MRDSRQMLTCFKLTGLFVIQLAFSSAIVSAQDTVDLKVDFSAESQCRIACDYEHVGTVLVTPEDQKQGVTSLPLNVNAKMSFFQRINGDSQAIRFYERANAKIKLDQGETNPKLDVANRLIVARLKSSSSERVEMASIADTLQQDELDLIQNAGDPLTLPAVLNKRKVKEGDKWEPSEDALAKLLNVHEIVESNVQLLLKKADSRLARIYIMGTVIADVDDVTTQMEVSGIAIVDLKAQQVSSFKLGIRETRAPGQIAPGFEGRTKIDLRITANASSPNLSNEVLAKLTKNRKIRQRLKWESEPGRFVLNYDPRWKMIAAEDDAAILRFIDGNELLTQCNVVQLPSRPADNFLTLEKYKKEVAKIVAEDENAQLVSASSMPMSDGKSVLRVVVAGDEDGLVVNWFYYHVSIDDGRQVTLVFTLAESLASRVTTLADQMISEFAFKPLPKKVETAKGDSVKSHPGQSSRKR